MPQGTLYRPGKEGHRIAAEWNDDAASRAAAKAIFDAIYTNKEGRVADMSQGQDGVMLKAGEFDPDVQTSLMFVPKLISG